MSKVLPVVMSSVAVGPTATEENVLVPQAVENCRVAVETGPTDKVPVPVTALARVAAAVTVMEPLLTIAPAAVTEPPARGSCPPAVIASVLLVRIMVGRRVSVVPSNWPAPMARLIAPTLGLVNELAPAVQAVGSKKRL